MFARLKEVVNWAWSFAGGTTNPATCGGIESTEPITLSSNGRVKHRCRLPMENFRKGVAEPTATRRNGVAGFLFAAAAEELYAQFCVPSDWDGASDIDIILACVLNADETANDDIDWETSVISVNDHEDVDVAGTQTPGASHDIGNFNAAGMLHEVVIILDYDSGACPITTGDYLTAVISRTANIGGGGYVAGVIVIDICVEYQANKSGEAV